jgi:hypothetical protein
MQSRTSRIRPPRAVVEQVEEYLLSQVGVYDNLSMNVSVPPPPRTRGYVEDLDLRVEIIPPSASEKYRLEAKYDPTNSVLYVNLLYFEENYEGRELAEALHRVVAHELVHVYQILYSRSRDDDPRVDSPTAGLPGLRERTPQYRQETGELLHHRLDDNEFYPRLEDTINAIKFLSRRNPDEIASIVSYVVGESNSPAYRSKHLKEPMAWLKDLGRYAPKKFIKAVRKIKNEFPETTKMRTADFFRQVSPPDELSTLSNGTPTGKATDLKDKGEGSQMPNGDGARNIGRPSPDSPNLKSRNLDRSESYGRKPAEGFDGGYVHDSGSGSARVIPYDSGFANNSSPLRNAGLIRPPQHLIDQVAEIGKGLLAQYWLRKEKEDSSKGGLDAESVEGLEWILEDLEYLPLGVKRGEHDEEEVVFQVNNTQRAFSEVEEQLKSANLTYSDFFKLKAKVDQLDAQSIFNDPRGNKALIGSITDMTSDILRELKKWSTGGKQYIPTLMRDDYLEAVEQLSKYKVKDSGRYYIEDDELGLVAVHLQESSHGAAQYYWDGIHHIIFNVLKNMTELPLKYLQDRETIAGHELVHAMQQHYANKAGIEEAGLPSQKRDKQFRFDMKEKQKELRVQYAREGMDFELISIHALDDIEFYSRLLDEVTDFKRRRVSADRVNDEIRKWISKRPFFVSLKRFKRKNWKKAVGIFVDAVTPEPRSKKAARPIRIDKAKIKDLTKKAIKILEEVAQKTNEDTLSEALKRKTMYGKIYLGSYIVKNEKNGYDSSVDIEVMVKDTHENGAYAYDPSRLLHRIEIYIKDQPIRLLTSPFYNISIKPSWVKHIYSILIHEITHAIDQIKYQQIEDNFFGGQGSHFDKSKIKTRKDQRQTLETYYNNPSEVKAYLQQIADEVEEYLNQKHGGVSKDSIKNGWKDAFGYYGSKTWRQVSSYLTPKNQKYIKKAVLSYLMGG